MEDDGSLEATDASYLLEEGSSCCHSLVQRVEDLCGARSDIGGAATLRILVGMTGRGRLYC